MAGRKPTVSFDTVYDVLLQLPVFDINQKPVEKGDIVWDTALNNLKYQITKKNLHQRFYGNRLLLQTKLKIEKYSNNYTTNELVLDANKPGSKPEKSDSVNTSSLKTVINALDELNKLMSEVSMKPLIRKFSVKPFHVIYSLPAQLDLYKEFIKIPDHPVLISVYEGLIDKTVIYNRESESVLFITMFGEGSNASIPFFQAVSEKVDKHYISFFIGEFLKQTNVSVPRQCYASCSFKLVEGLSVMLNHQSLQDYSLQCFHYLNCLMKDQGENLFKLPVCILNVNLNKTMQYIRLIMNYTMNAEDDCVKDFYFECILFLCYVDNFQGFITFVANLFKILCSKYFDKDTENARLAILNIISSVEFENFKKGISECQQNDDLDITLFTESFEERPYERNEIYVYFKKLQIDIYKRENFESADKEYEHTEMEKMSVAICNHFENPKNISSEVELEINPYRKLMFLSSLTKFLTIFPVWSNLIPGKSIDLNYHNKLNQKHYNDMYQIIFPVDNEPLPAYEFLQNHVTSLFQSVESYRESLRGLEINIDRLKTLNDTGDICKLEDENANSCRIITYPYLRYCEDWKGKGNSKSETINEELDNYADQTDIEFKQELLFFQNMLEKSTVENEHDYCRNELSNQCNAKEDTREDCRLISNLNRKPAEYLNPCPYLDLMYNKPNATGYKDPIIANGNQKPPRSKSNKKYTLESTSAFDAVVEVFKQAMKNYKDFYEFCKTVTDNDVRNETFLKLVFAYANETNVRKFNTNRFHYLFKNGIVIGDRIYCDDDLTLFFGKLMALNHSVTKIQTCSVCHSIIDCSNQCSLYLPPSTILKSANPEDLTQNEFVMENYTVDKCGACGNFIQETFDAQNYLSISINNHPVKIGNIKEIIFIKGKKFVLVGLIEHKPTQIVGGQTHYVAFCRFVKGNWQLRDNTKSNFLKVDQKKKINVSLIIYVEVAAKGTSE